MKKSSKKDKARIYQWVKDWQKTLFLNDWRINVCWSEEDEGNVAGRSDCTSRYFDATITFFPYTLRQDLETQWHIVIHEMTHIVLSHMQSLQARSNNGTMVTYDEHKDAIEQTTTRLANIFTSAWPHKRV